jgi:CRISP-associated protein Cas1
MNTQGHLTAAHSPSFPCDSPAASISANPFRYSRLWHWAGICRHSGLCDRLTRGDATDSHGNPDRVAAQIEAKQSGQGVRIATALVQEKIKNAIATLEAAIPASPTRELAIMKQLRNAKELSTKPPKSMSALLGVEGRAAQSYFAAWQSLPLRWKGLTRRGIPDDWRRVGQRQSLNGTRQKGRNRHASHPVNAMLNYAYAILESQVRMHIVAEGYDPTIGYLHTSTPERQALVLDLMEPQRPVVDRKVLEFVQAYAFHPADFTIRSDGVCRLNPEMARQIVILFESTLQLSDYKLDEFLVCTPA